MRVWTVSLLSLLIAGSLAAQNARSSTQVDTTSTGTGLGPAVDSDGELSAVIYNDGSTGGSNTVNVVTSDGRGLTWSAPVRVDQDAGVPPARKFTQEDSIVVVGNSIYVAWEDERNGASNEDLFFNYSDDGGVTWTGEVLIDKGTAAGTGAVRDWRMQVAPGSPNAVYFLITTDPTTSANEEMYLNTSQDGGATFSGAMAVSSLAAGTEDVDSIALAVNGQTVCVAWQGDRNAGASLDDIWFQQSTDGGTTWAVADLQIDSSGSGVGDAEGTLGLAADGASLVAIVWQEELTSASQEELRMAVSTDGGLTFGTDVLVGGYLAGTDDVDDAQVVIGPTATISAAWDDNRSGSDEVYVATSIDNGATFVETQISSTGGGFPTFARSKSPHSTCWALAYTNGTFPNSSKASFTRDGGITWSAGFDTSDNTGFDVDFAEVGYNELYNNAICAWLSDDNGQNNVYVGGFRPQTLTPTGTPFTAGASVGFDVSNFCRDEAGFSFLVVASGSPGNVGLPGDGRNIGLNNDAFLAKSSAISALSGSINGAGAGSTSNLTFPAASKVPVGTMLYMVAISRQGGTFGSITDVAVETVQ